MSDAIKSVFRRKEYEYIYEPEYVEFTDCGGYISRGVSVHQRKNFISDKKIGEYKIDIPMLNEGEKIFLEDIQETVTIKNRVRGTDGSVVYYIEDLVVDTKDSDYMKQQCEKIRDACKTLLNEIDEVKQQFDNYKSKYKYQHRFFNRRITHEGHV